MEKLLFNKTFGFNDGKPNPFFLVFNGWVSLLSVKI